MLAKQNLMLNFQDGMDTKTDSKQLPLGTFYQVTNGVYRTPLELKKRNGYDDVRLQTVNNTFITNPRSINSYNNALNVLNDTSLFSYSEKVQKWIEKGHISNLELVSNYILKNNFNQTKLSVASNFGISAYTWKDSSGGCKVSVADNTGTTLFLQNASLTSLGDNPKVVVNSNSFYFFFTEGTDLKYRKLNSASPVTLEPEVIVRNNLDNTNPVYDVIELNERVYCGYNSTVVGAKLQIFYIDQIDIPSSNSGVVGATPTTTISLYADIASRILVSYYDGTSVFALIVNFSLTGQLLPITLIETISNINNISSISDQLNDFKLVYTQTAAQSYNYLIKKNTLTYSGTVGTPSVLKRSVGQASKLFLYNNNVYTMCIHDSTLQSTYFLCDLSGNIEAKISPSISGSILPNNSLSEVPTLAPASYLFTSQIKAELITENQVSFSTFGVNSTVINFTPAVNYQDEVIDRNLYITGGILRGFDGAVVTENGFFVFPENLTAGTNSAAGGLLTNGTRQYVATYAWYDNKGLLHRSTTSIPLSTIQSAGGTTQTQEIVIPTLRLTYKTQVIIEVYRTESLGTIFYKVSSNSAPLNNNEAVDFVTFTDTISDPSLISQELLYTTGGILDNDQAPNSSIITKWKNRLWLAGLENPNQLAYSKEVQDGFPAQFSDFLRLLIDDTSNKITALAAMDDKLIIFKENSVFALAGNGPNNAGQQNDYGVPERISSDVGCVDANSVVLMPSGLMFKSQKGIYILDRGLTAVYVGYPVEAYNNLTINSGVLVANTNQIRFLTSGNLCLVYDYFVQKWSVFDNHGGKDADILNNVYYYLRNDDIIFKENSTTFLDNGQPISLQLDTGWLSFAGIQGFQRVYKLLALGEYKSPHKLRIQAAYNFVEAYVHEKTVDTSEFINQTTYGSASPYGSDLVFGGSSNLNAYQLRLDMKVQKTQSIRILIKELQNDTYGEGLSLANLSFEVGTKIGQFQVNQSQTFGTR